jgi:hypothetical protein
LNGKGAGERLFDEAFAEAEKLSWAAHLWGASIFCEAPNPKIEFRYH